MVALAAKASHTYHAVAACLSSSARRYSISMASSAAPPTSETTGCQGEAVSRNDSTTPPMMATPAMIWPMRIMPSRGCAARSAPLKRRAGVMARSTTITSTAKAAAAISATESQYAPRAIT